MKDDIDVIITWVDGNDPMWQQELVSHKPSKSGDEATPQKFRDWDTLRYIFRGIEQFMPWVRKIHFVTYGHLPKWMNDKHPKLHIVTHDRIFHDPSHLPTFNSNAIEFNFLGIEDLSEQFVYFNDDMLVLQPTIKERLFLNGKPRDFLIQTIPRKGWLYYTFFSNVAWRYNLNNNVALINRHFNKNESIKAYRDLYYNSRYGIVGNVKNYISNLFQKFYYFEHYHQAQPFLRSIWEEASSACKTEIENTSMQKFREKSGITAYLFRYWHLVSGNFEPIFENDFIIKDLCTIDNINEISQVLKEKRYRFVCLNDMSFSMNDQEFLEGRRIIINTLSKILPLKSKYEK